MYVDVIVIIKVVSVDYVIHIICEIKVDIVTFHFTIDRIKQ